MKKLNLLTILILVTTVLFSTEQAFAEASAELPIETVVQPAVSVDTTATSSSGSMNSGTGAIIDELKASFKLQTNDTNGYDFIIYSQIATANGGTVSAFDKDGNILFGNTYTRPTETAVNNAKLGTADNQNVIGYTLNNSVTAGMSITYEKNSSDYENCYRISFDNETTTGTLSQIITGNPLPNTFYLGEDTSGSYSATVYVTAVSKI